MFDAHDIAKKLRAATSETAGRAIVSRLKVAQLHEVFRAAGYPVHRGRKAEVAEKLVFWLVGHRLDTQAILNAKW